MEDQNRFDLEKALRAWRDDCACRPGISTDDVRELESDLRERVGDLQKHGRDGSEAFREAVRQLGSPGALAREFGRENPLALWRERVFWMVASGFAISLWHFLSGGTILWFLNTFGVLLPFNPAAWSVLAGSLPVLAAAVLLATGRLEPLAARLRGFLWSRQRLALAGVGLLVIAILVRLFGPGPLSLPREAQRVALLLLSISAWQLVLLSLAVLLYQPVPAGGSPDPKLRTGTARAAVWRDRVFWMAVGGLLTGFWQTVSWFGINALFYTGDFSKPFQGGLLFTSAFLLFHLSPIIVIVLLLRPLLRSRKDISGATLVRRRILAVIVPAFICAWTALHLLSDGLWMPRGVAVPFPAVLANFVTTLRWVWPLGLAALIFWLAPGSPERHTDSELAE